MKKIQVILITDGNLFWNSEKNVKDFITNCCLKSNFKFKSNVGDPMKWMKDKGCVSK